MVSDEKEEAMYSFTVKGDKNGLKDCNITAMEVTQKLHANYLTIRCEIDSGHLSSRPPISFFI
jgi:hypothetical protein